MKINIAITDDAGKYYQGEISLEPTLKKQHAKHLPLADKPLRLPKNGGLDFNLPIRRFILSHVTSENTGQVKFVILLARLVKGNIGAKVDADTFLKEWNKVRGPIGCEYQSMYATRARDKGWIESPKKGIFVLARDWKGAFSR